MSCPQVLGMWQAQQPEQPQQTTVIQRARSDASQPPTPAASGAPPAAAVSTGFSAFSQQRDAAVSPSPQVPVWSDLAILANLCSMLEAL
jgi:hypothetical protein